MENVNVEKLVSDIKSGEEAHRTGCWKKWCEARGLGRRYGEYFYASSYEDHMTSLYTLRALLRGRMHRKNPPPEIRDFNRSMRDNNTPGWQLGWDMEEHNRKVAMSVVPHYAREEAA